LFPLRRGAVEVIICGDSYYFHMGYPLRRVSNS
jgi:hypothetical protein